MFAVRDNQGRVVRRFHTEAEARVFVRSAKSPVNSRTIKGAEQIVKAALEKNVIMTVKAPSGDTYTAGPYTPAVRTPTGHGYVAYGYGRSRFLRPEFRGSAWEVARFLVEYCGRGNALEAARQAAGKTIDHEALLAAGSRDRMDRARAHILHNRNPWAKSPDNTVKSPDNDSLFSQIRAHGRIRFEDRRKRADDRAREGMRWTAYVSAFGYDAAGQGSTKLDAARDAVRQLPAQYARHFQG